MGCAPEKVPLPEKFLIIPRMGGLSRLPGSFSAILILSFPTENSMERPNCGLLNPPTSERCDCGFDFTSSTMKESLLSRAELRRASADPYPFPFFGIFGFLVRLTFKWLHGAMTGEARRRRQLKSAYERGDGIHPDS